MKTLELYPTEKFYTGWGNERIYEDEKQNLYIIKNCQGNYVYDTNIAFRITLPENDVEPKQSHIEGEYYSTNIKIVYDKDLQRFERHLKESYGLEPPKLKQLYEEYRRLKNG